MSDEIPPVVPIESRPMEVVRQPLAEPPQPTPAMEAATPEQIHLVDAAFTGNSDKQDSLVGLVGLTLTAPWVADLIADHFRTPPEEEDTPEKPAEPR